MAALFGIPPAALPVDWSAFEGYNRDLLASDMLGVGELARELAQRILHGRGSWLPVPHWYRALTSAWMPEGLRDEFSLEYGEAEKLAAARARVWLPRIYRRLPEAFRFVGPYQEAQSRLMGRRVNAFARISNRFWIGEPQLRSHGVDTL
jgi:hypothetical protein